MGAEVIILFNPYTYNFLKGLTHSALDTQKVHNQKLKAIIPTCILFTLSKSSSSNHHPNPLHPTFNPHFQLLLF